MRKFSKSYLSRESHVWALFANHKTAFCANFENLTYRESRFDNTKYDHVDSVSSLQTAF